MILVIFKMIYCYCFTRFNNLGNLASVRNERISIFKIVMNRFLYEYFLLKMTFLISLIAISRLPIHEFKINLFLNSNIYLPFWIFTSRKISNQPYWYRHLGFLKLDEPLLISILENIELLNWNKSRHN